MTAPGTAVVPSGTCGAGRVSVTAPSRMTSTTGGTEWVFWKPYLFRWDGARWVQAATRDWFYGSADAAGLRPLTGGAPWVAHATGTPLAAGAPVEFNGLPAGYYAVVDVLVWHSTGRTEEPVRSLPAGTYCRV